MHKLENNIQFHCPQRKVINKYVLTFNMNQECWSQRLTKMGGGLWSQGSASPVKSIVFCFVGPNVCWSQSSDRKRKKFLIRHALGAVSRRNCSAWLWKSVNLLNIRKLCCCRELAGRGRVFTSTVLALAEHSRPCNNWLDLKPLNLRNHLFKEV